MSNRDSEYGDLVTAVILRLNEARTVWASNHWAWKRNGPFLGDFLRETVSHRELELSGLIEELSRVLKDLKTLRSELAQGED